MKLLIYTLVLFFILSGMLYALDLKGLVLYLPFDEGSGKIAKDLSGNGNDGTLQGKVDWVPGKFGKAISVKEDAANNMVVVKASKSLDITDAISMVAWVNFGPLPDIYNSIITKAETYMLHTDEQGGKVRVDPLVWNGGSYGTWPSPAAVLVPYDEWHHVAGVFNGKQIITYLDGKPGTAFQRNVTIDVTNADVVIGRDSRGCCNTRKSAQIIDEVMIWNRALSEAEVNEIMKGNFMAVSSKEKLASKWGYIKTSF